MNTTQIDSILLSNRHTRCVYGGCYPIDRLPTIEKLPYALVVNSDKSSGPGIHWLALYFSASDTSDFFDSLGNRPHVYSSQLSKYMRTYSQNQWTNSQLVQSPLSATCGQHAIAFIVKRCAGLSADKILSDYGPKLSRNDDSVVMFVNRIVRKQFTFTHDVYRCGKPFEYASTQSNVLPLSQYIHIPYK
jgi:hypothetical protein